MPDLPATALRDASGPQSRLNALSPGLVGLFVQGIEIGMVFSQLATWMSLPGRTERRFITVLTVFITTVGFVQTAGYLLSIWRIYVEHYGEPSRLRQKGSTYFLFVTCSYQFPSNRCSSGAVTIS
ncbi:hypothetical protein EDB92DRAFT_1855182 [Lactarius akahatsu]|uniref:Uncharacterized protein n=1 Tax=Lactarius akahatsu TaxID=416441 RepID=A0AAD4LIL2_9AGAM|nr:hypothetical protein EDB92DRAFT_1855182 [Lactarius akahatsu]